MNNHCVLTVKHITAITLSVSEPNSGLQERSRASLQLINTITGGSYQGLSSVDWWPSPYVPGTAPILMGSIILENWNYSYKLHHFWVDVPVVGEESEMNIAVSTVSQVEEYM